MESNNLKVLIAEDESKFRSYFTENLLQLSGVVVGGVAKDGEQALSMLLNDDYDLAFLDVRMPKLSGIQIISKLQEIRKKDLPKFVFVTAYTDFLQEAFNYGVSDYLVKPFTNERLTQTIHRIFDGFQKKVDEINQFGLACKVDGEVKIVQYDDIKYIEAYGNYVNVICQSKEFRILELIKSLESRLPKNKFVRIHRQFILNLNFLHRIEKGFHGNYVAVLNDQEDSSLNIGRKYLQSVRTILNFK